MDFDVIVAGAGAGGAAAAYYLTQAGLDCLVVDRAHLPRYKACGGAIPRPTLARFPFDLTGLVQAAPSGVRFTFPGQPAVDVPLPDRPVVMVMRSEFDAYLLAQSGAEVLAGQAVTSVVETGDQVQVHCWVPTPAVQRDPRGRDAHTWYLLTVDGELLWAPDLSLTSDDDLRRGPDDPGEHLGAGVDYDAMCGA